MKKLETKYPKLTDFFICYCHEDVASLDQAVQQFLDENGNGSENKTLEEIQSLLATSEFSEQEKNEFIQKYVRPSLPKSFQNHLDWFEDVADKIEKHLNQK